MMSKEGLALALQDLWAVSQLQFEALVPSMSMSDCCMLQVPHSPCTLRVLRGQPQS